MTNTTTASKCMPKRPRICINWNPPFQTQIYLVKVPLNVIIVKQDLLHKKQFLKNLWSEVWKGGILFVTKSSLWPYYDQNKLPSDILSYHIHPESKENQTRFGQTLSKMWTNNWAKPALNFDIFYIELIINDGQKIMVKSGLEFIFF